MINVNFNDVKRLNRGMKSYEKKAMTAIHAYGRSSAITLQNEAKRNAKWTNRTGQARASIKGTYTASGSVGTIRLEGYAKKPSGTKTGKWGADYFQHLEYHHGKKWAVLRPTAEKNLPRVSKVISNRLSKIKIME